MSVKYSILGLLHYEDMHGYRIKEHIEKNFGYMWSVNYGQIYPNLKKLEQEGLISMREEVQNGKKGPPKKLYSLTDAGREAFQEWLFGSPERSMLLRDPFLMRFVFFGFGDKERALELIDEQIMAYEGDLAGRLSKKEKWRTKDVFVNQLAELGIEMNKMMLAWLKETRKKVAAGVQEQ
ncbi:transcriptional regulator, PadR-like family [Desulfatibacillum aliphaticivorans]|uniref:Transcriptional regulator, PadR-like family n=1 Tax=Desulfatibacillum aliphaticivorans TaxID=218208 RepID=B8FGB8_DESAL|nr:PadR family transcriptional regulator [Desulfatibacillum aliphaticivorans]ACL03798.1 transcriptional regulator, PadR-like family [Desulfatibacillum aliphaticivorans]